MIVCMASRSFWQVSLDCLTSRAGTLQSMSGVAWVLSFRCRSHESSMFFREHLQHVWICVRSSFEHALRTHLVMASIRIGRCTDMVDI